MSIDKLNYLNFLKKCNTFVHARLYLGQTNKVLCVVIIKYVLVSILIAPEYGL